jgi:hypothetical protein
LPGLAVHISEAQQGKMFEKIAKQSSRGWLQGDLGGMGNRNIISCQEGFQTENHFEELHHSIVLFLVFSLPLQSLGACQCHSGFNKPD